ncbi:MAG: hypothetical protein CMJ16_07275 [Peredibacter sp.]|mgnify:CR=1 FL=1|nr:hypothetical protein [Peredibacter sp.]
MRITLDNAFKINGKQTSIDLFIKEKAINFLIGENGVGKSSLFTYMKISKDLFQGTRVAFVDQEKLNPLSDLSVSEILAVVIEELVDVKSWEECEHVKNLEIEKLLDKKVSCLSGGENQKLKLALGLILPFDILLLDEPLQSLDVKSQKQVISTLEDISKEKAVLIIEHNVKKYESFNGCLNVMKEGNDFVEVSHGRS